MGIKYTHNSVNTNSHNTQIQWNDIKMIVEIDYENDKYDYNITSVLIANTLAYLGYKGNLVLTYTPHGVTITFSEDPHDTIIIHAFSVEISKSIRARYGLIVSNCSIKNKYEIELELHIPY